MAQDLSPGLAEDFIFWIFPHQPGQSKVATQSNYGCISLYVHSFLCSVGCKTYWRNDLLYFINWTENVNIVQNFQHFTKKVLIYYIFWLLALFGFTK